jgi:hypothetical protein
VLIGVAPIPMAGPLGNRFKGGRNVPKAFWPSNSALRANFAAPGCTIRGPIRPYSAYLAAASVALGVLAGLSSGIGVPGGGAVAGVWLESG